MKRPICVIVLAAGLAAPSGAAAGSQPATVRFTVPQAVEVALAVNPQILEVRERQGEFQTLIRQARAEALPRVDATVSLVRTRDPGLRNSPFFSRLLEGPDPIPPEALAPFFFTNYVWRIDVEQPIYSFGRVGGALAAARHEVEGIRLDVAAAENRIARDVVVACYGYLLARERLAVLETERRARERQLQQVQDRLDLEDATRLDLLRARVALANLRPEILAAENEVRVAMAAVNEILKRPPEAPIEIDESLVLPAAVPELPEPAALLELAETHRPELRRFRIDRRVLDERVRVTRADLLPEVDAVASYGINTFRVENLTDLAFRSWSVGVNLRWTLFDGYRTPSGIDALRSQASQKRHEEDAFRSGLSVDLQRTHGDWRRALEAVEVARMAVEEAREAERVAEESYRWGAATVLDVLDSERALRQAELNRAQAAHDALVALAEIKYLVGFRADAPAAALTAAVPSTESAVAGDTP